MTEIHAPRRRGRPPTPLHLRFWPKVDVRGPDECWPWTGGTTSGIGTFRLTAGRSRSAHGYAKEYATGTPCPDGMIPQHTCTTDLSKICCNPAHIVYAPNGEMRKGKGVHGDKHPSTRISDAQVREIRRRLANGETTTALAAEFGTHRQYISHIKHGHARTTVT